MFAPLSTFLFILLLVCLSTVNATKTLGRASKFSDLKKHSVSTPSIIPLLSYAKGRSPKAGSSSMSRKIIKTTELSPFHGLIHTARGGLLDLQASAMQIASSRSSNELLDNILGALFKHKAITAMGVVGICYLTRRSFPDPMT